MKQSYQTRKHGKKGMIYSDLGAILLFALLMVIFFSLFKFTLGKTSFDLAKESQNVKSSVVILNILRSPVEIDRAQASISQIISLSRIDSSKKSWLEGNLGNILENSFLQSSCNMVCIQKKTYQDESDMWDRYTTSQCKEDYPCPCSHIIIPSYNSEPIILKYGAVIKEVKVTDVRVGTTSTSYIGAC